MSGNKIRVLFVCLGNICRSPAAEGNFLHTLRERGLEDRFFVDSAGTGAYHIGEPVNSKARRTASRYGVSLDSIARQFKRRDFENFDYIFAMDRQNHEDILRLTQDNADRERVIMFRRFDPEAAAGSEPEVPDPYFGGSDGFDTVQQIMMRTSTSLVDWLLKNHAS